MGCAPSEEERALRNVEGAFEVVPRRHRFCKRGNHVRETREVGFVGLGGDESRIDTCRIAFLSLRRGTFLVASMRRWTPFVRWNSPFRWMAIDVGMDNGTRSIKCLGKGLGSKMFTSSTIPTKVFDGGAFPNEGRMQDRTSNRGFPGSTDRPTRLSLRREIEIDSHRVPRVALVHAIVPISWTRLYLCEIPSMNVHQVLFLATHRARALPSSSIAISESRKNHWILSTRVSIPTDSDPSLFPNGIAMG